MVVVGVSGSYGKEVPRGGGLHTDVREVLWRPGEAVHRCPGRLLWGDVQESPRVLGRPLELSRRLLRCPRPVWEAVRSVLGGSRSPEASYSASASGITVRAPSRACRTPYTSRTLMCSIHYPVHPAVHHWAHPVLRQLCPAVGWPADQQ